MCQFTDCFYSAVRTLAGDGPVKQRLLSAYSDNLECLSEAEIPEPIREGFERLKSAMSTAKPLAKEAPAAAAIRKMSAKEAALHATTIVAMFSELVRAKSTGEALSYVSRAEGKDAESSVPTNLALN
jgi:hypothetical protein